MRYTFIYLTLTCLLISCNKEQFTDKNLNNKASVDKINIILNKDTQTLINEFTELLSRAVYKEPELRQFIKEESLKQFNKDYDILYKLSKNKILKNNLTFEQTLLKYEKYENQLSIIQENVPLLTIFVPNLPLINFSAETWNSNKEIPLVANNYEQIKGIPLYEDGNIIDFLKSNEIPGVPSLVVKKNERVIYRNKTYNKLSATTNNNLFDNFEFVSKIFDNLTSSKSNIDNIKKSNKTASVNINQSSLDKIYEAYNIFGIDPQYWQRDFIYYNLTHINNQGPLQVNIRERILSLQINRDALTKISDQSSDPKLITNPNQTVNVPNTYTRSMLTDIVQKNAWTDGKFEFRFDVLINNKSGIGSVYPIFVPLDPTELFYFSYNHTSTRIVNGKHQAIIVYLLDPNGRGGTNFWGEEVSLNEEILTWDLSTNAPIWRISLYEVDSQETITSKETLTNEFASNFNLDLKIGLKFGTSNKEVHTREVTTVRTLGEDDLGSVLINFSDPIIVGTNRAGYIFNEYSNRYFKIKVAPVIKHVN